ncbi:metallophosphoesterase [Microbacterium phage Pumpernickel]|uniref:Metallophosphoesterase n=1 Tax=Microbacterium phage Pumpernickel TaxID=2885983 RepID=A0AAE9C2J2_9CAUD|nr:metallophosphoesterase [Microbacterium phage Pumpernickel]UDL15963.1 metallophosphoesterase [Microbacterium phage Pumpernickel]
MAAALWYAYTMTERHFITDLHDGHEFVSRLRGFETVEEHRAALDENIRKAVRKDDTLYILGDLAMNPHKAGTFAWIQSLPGTKHFISGNHDLVHPAHSKSLKEQQRPEWRDTFATVNPFARIKVLGKTVLLSHFPYEGEGGRENITERWAEYRLRDEGHFLIHGHTHDTMIEHYSAKGTPLFHAGVDAHGLKPVSEHEITSWVERHL